MGSLPSRTNLTLVPAKALRSPNGKKCWVAATGMADVQVLGQGDQEIAEAVAVRPRATVLRVEEGLRLERPVQQMHAVFGAAHGLVRRVEIGFHVDEQRGPACRCRSP